MTWAGERKSISGFAVAFVLVLGVDVVSYQSARNLTESHHWVAHTQEVLIEMEVMRSLLTESQNTMRGYLLTGEESFLKAYQSAIDRLPVTLSVLLELTADNSHQHRLMTALATQQEAILVSFARNIKLRQTQELKKEQKRSSLVESTKKVEQIVQTLNEMKQEEYRLLNTRTENGRRTANITMVVIVIGNLLALGIIGWGMLRIRSELRVRKDTEAELAMEKNRLHFAITGANIGTWHWDLVNRELTFSDKARFLFGLPRHVLISYERVLETIPPEDRESIDRTVKEALKNKEDYSVEHRVIWPDGTTHWIAAMGRGFYDSPHGQAIRMEGIVVDVTTRKQAEEVLQRSHADLERQIQERTAELNRQNTILKQEIVNRQMAEEETRQLTRQNTFILHSIGEGIYGLDLEGRATFVNPAGARMLGYEPAELMGRCMHVTVHHMKPDGTPYPQEECPMSRALHDGTVYHVEDEVLWRKDGTCFPVQYTCTPIRNECEETVGTVVAFSDITLWKQTKNEIQRKNRDLETLIYVISHDLGEPLRAIQNFSQIVVDRYTDHLDLKAQDYLHRVIEGGKRMSHLLSEILAFSRAQRLEPPDIKIQSTTVVKETVARLQKNIDETHATISMAPDLPSLQADHMWVTQAIYNLIANALKFTREGIPPDVEIAPYDGQGRYPGEVGLVVYDRGPGVNPAHAERIFKIFQRAVGRKVAGTGAGLAIVRQVAERHGGHAWVEPREGGGSAFFITFGPERSPTKEVSCVH